MVAKKNTKKIVAKKPVKKVMPAQKKVAKKAAPKKVAPAKKTIVKKVAPAKKMVASVKAPVTSSSYEDKSYVAYFGEKKAAWYKRANEKYSRGGKFTLVWSWWAFCFPIIYLLVRKCYLYALLLILVITGIMSLTAGNVGLVTLLLLSCFTAIVSPFFVLQRFRTVKARAEMLFKNETDRLILLSCRGGKNYFFLILSVLVYAFFFSTVAFVMNSYYTLMTNPERLERFLIENPEAAFLFEKQVVTQDGKVFIIDGAVHSDGNQLEEEIIVEEPVVE